MGYSGTTSFIFEIERFLDEQSYFTTKESTNSVNIELNVSGFAFFKEGVTHLKPENCYPDEYEAYIIEAVHDNKDWQNDLTDDEYDSVIDKIHQMVSKNA